MKKSIHTFLAHSGVHAVTEKKMTMEPMTGVTITIEGADEDEIQKRFAAAMSAIAQTWASDPEMLKQRLK